MTRGSSRSYRHAFLQTLGCLNASTQIGGVRSGNVAFLVAVVDIGPYENIKKKKGFNIVVVKVRTVFVAENVNGHVRQAAGSMRGAC